MKRLIKDIANNTTTKDNAINSLKEDSDYIEEIKKLKRNGNRSTIISTYTDFVNFPFQITLIKQIIKQVMKQKMKK